MAKPSQTIAELRVFQMTPERVALGRIAAGVTLACFSRSVSSWWTGNNDDRASPLVQAIGGRDIALGLGALFALRREAPARGWFEAAALADGTDVLATLILLRRAPGIGRVAILGAAISGLVANLRTAAALPISGRDGEAL